MSMATRKRRCGPRTKNIRVKNSEQCDHAQRVRTRKPMKHATERLIATTTTVGDWR